MTENEAIEILRNNFPKTCKMVDGRYKGGFDDIECEFGKALLLSISALEEIQRYRAIGSVEAITEVVKFLSPVGDDTIIGDLDTLYKYKRIGTVEECQQAVERQRAKKPICNDKMALWDYTCPVCGDPLIQQGYTYNYCDMCGNRIDWSDTD